MICPRCGQPGDAGRYCGRCGLFLTGPAATGGPVRFDKPTQQFPAPPTGPVGGPTGAAAFPPPGPSYPPPDPTTRYVEPATPSGPGGPAPRGPRNSRALILAAVVALVLVAGGAATFLALRGGDQPSPTVAAPPSTAAVGTTTGPPATVTTVAPSTVVLTTTVGPTTTAATGLSDVGAQPIACNSGYVVQVASEADQASFVRRVDQVRAAGQLPAGSHWSTIAASCPVFAATGDLPVLWAGPFADVAQACATRLASPWDAGVKGTQPGSNYTSCVCPAQSTALPALDTGAARNVWTSELQRLLDKGLGYDVGTLDGDTWGVYTSGTADAVRRFQADRGLPATGRVDGATWSALHAAGC